MMTYLLLTSKIIYYRYEKILSIIIYSILVLILNIIFSTNIAECTPPVQHIENEHDVLYNNYKTYENFKEHIDSQILDNTPLILDKYEPLSMTFLRTALYTLENIHGTFIDKVENTEIMSNQFYDAILIFDKNIVYNILENMAIINIEKENELIFNTIADFLRIEKERQSLGFTDFEMRNIRLMNNGFSTPPTILEITIPNYKISMDLKNPCILPQPTNLPDLLHMLIQDVVTKTSIYQNYYSVHELPDSIMEKIISDTVKTYHNNPDYWRAYHSSKGDLHRELREVIMQEIQDSYLQQPHVSKLQLQIYRHTLYYFSKDENH